MVLPIRFVPYVVRGRFGRELELLIEKDIVTTVEESDRSSESNSHDDENTSRNHAFVLTIKQGTLARTLN